MKRVLCLVLLLLGFVNLAQAQQKDTDPFMIAGVMALREGKPDTTKKDLKILDAPVIGDMSYSICLDFIEGNQFFLEHNRTSKKFYCGASMPQERIQNHGKKVIKRCILKFRRKKHLKMGGEFYGTFRSLKNS